MKKAELSRFFIGRSRLFMRPWSVLGNAREIDNREAKLMMHSKMIVSTAKARIMMMGSYSFYTYGSHYRHGKPTVPRAPALAALCIVQLSVTAL
jgi:hypothetical protein